MTQGVTKQPFQANYWHENKRVRRNSSTIRTVQRYCHIIAADLLMCLQCFTSAIASGGLALYACSSVHLIIVSLFMYLYLYVKNKPGHGTIFILEPHMSTANRPFEKLGDTYLPEKVYQSTDHCKRLRGGCVNCRLCGQVSL